MYHILDHGEYMVYCEVVGTEDTKVIERDDDDLPEATRKKRSLSEMDEAFEDKLHSTGEFTRVAEAGTVFISKEFFQTDLPPLRVLDLKVVFLLQYFFFKSTVFCQIYQYH